MKEQNDTKMKQPTSSTITIFQSTDLEKIYMAHNQLQNAGITSFIKNEFRAYNIGYIELQVDQKDTRKATELLCEAFPEEFGHRLLCPYCGSDQVRISSSARNPLWRKIQIGMQQLKYQMTRELPAGTYQCEDCHKQFTHTHKRRQAPDRASGTKTCTGADQ